MIKSQNSHSQAQDFLNSLFESLEDRLPDGWEIDFEGPELHLYKVGGPTFLIHYHTASDQLWLSSSISGAHHFYYKEKKWVSTRENKDFFTIFLTDLKQLDCHLEFNYHA